MNVPCIARRYTLCRICGVFLVALILPTRAAANANSGGNHPPRAIIKPTPKIGVHPDVLAVPTLDGSQSFSPDFDFITFQWKDSSGMVIGTGSTVQVVIAFLGTHTYVLTVCDTHYASTDVNQTNPLHSCDSVATTVEVVLDLTPPVVDAPDITVSVTEPGSATVSKATSLSAYMLSGATTSAMDDVDLHPHFLYVVANNATVTGSTVFPEGDTPVNVFYADQAGNVGMSAATVHVVDRQDNDIFILTGEGNCFGTPCNDVIQRVRGGAVIDFCALPGGAAPAGGIIMDSSGRAISLRDYGGFGVEMLRCSVTGAPPEKFGWFQGRGGLPPGYPEPFPGMIFQFAGPGLSLARLREVVIDDKKNHGNPFVVNEDGYLLDLTVPAGSLNSNRPVIYHVTRNLWENAPDLGDMLSKVQINGQGASIFFHEGTTYAARGGCLDRIKNPLSIQASGTVGGVPFNLQLSLFGSKGEICSFILNNETVPEVNYMPTCPGKGPGFSFNVMDGLTQVLYDDFNGNGLTLISNSGAAGNGVLTHFSELPFDMPGDPANFFYNPNIGCLVYNQVRYTPLYQGFYFGGPIASTPGGLVAMFSEGPFSGSSLDVVDSSGKLAPIVKSGLGPIGPVTSWPPNVSAGLTLSVLIRTDSPVDVLVTDPNGKKLGMLNGAPVNDFGNDGADTGADSHPRFYAIKSPVPGDYTVQSVGTGTGPYTVHVYAVDTSKPFGQHILSSGIASPGAMSNQNFTMDAGAGIAFTNHPPIANAGPDQTVTAAANGLATVNLDGSASSDPDGDTLTFTWAGPFGMVTGAMPQVTLPVGDSVLQLTVDDGKGGTASSDVTITVNPAADTTPPVVTPPASITIPATEAAGARSSASAALAAFQAAGSAVDNVDPSPSRLSPQVGGVDVNASTLFPIGPTTVTFRFRDASGNVGSASSTVTVILGTPSIAAAIVNKGVDPSGARFYDLQFTCNGTGNARGVLLASLLFRTLSGTGSVTYNAPLSSALPINIGDLDVGAHSTVRIFLNVPSTVSRLSIVESVTLQNVAGTVFKTSAGQATSP